MKKSKLFRLSWDEKLGFEWMNIDNLELLLYSTRNTRKELLNITEVKEEKYQVCECGCERGVWYLDDRNVSRCGDCHKPIIPAEAKKEPIPQLPEKIDWTNLVEAFPQKSFMVPHSMLADLKSGINQIIDYTRHLKERVERLERGKG